MRPGEPGDEPHPSLCHGHAPSCAAGQLPHRHPRPRQQLQASVDVRPVEGLGIKISPQPLQHGVVLLVARVGDGLQQILITARPTAILGRTGPRAIDVLGVSGDGAMRPGDRLDGHAVQPSVPHVVLVRQFGADNGGNFHKPHPPLVPTFQLEGGIGEIPRRGSEAVQVAVRPHPVATCRAAGSQPSFASPVTSRQRHTGGTTPSNSTRRRYRCTGGRFFWEGLLGRAAGLAVGREELLAVPTPPGATTCGARLTTAPSRRKRPSCLGMRGHDSTLSRR